MILGWQAANLLQLPGTVPFEHTQVLLVAMALPTSIFLTCRSWQTSSVDVPVCLTFGVCNLCSFVGGLLFLLNVLIYTPTLLKHILGWFFLAFAAVRLASDLKILPGSDNQDFRPRGEHSRALMLGWAVTGVVSGGISGIFGVGVSQQIVAHRDLCPVVISLTLVRVQLTQGPPIMVWMTVARMDKGAMRGTNQASQIALQFLRVIMLLSTGVLRPCVLYLAVPLL